MTAMVEGHYGSRGASPTTARNEDQHHECALSQMTEVISKAPLSLVFLWFSWLGTARKWPWEVVACPLTSKMCYSKAIIPLRRYPQYLCVFVVPVDVADATLTTHSATEEHAYYYMLCAIYNKLI